MTDNLVERCEVATGPDREIDARIDCLLKGLTFVKWQGHYYECDKGPNFGGAEVHRFTASIDAAMELIPSGMDWRIDTMTGLPGAIVCVPNAWLSTKTAPRLHHGATPAIALCIAALCARTFDAVGGSVDPK